ncbi:UNVERIFIED_CONTAM: hypothetical protein NCL1_02744 [Trichonephila clavipes]
MGWRAGRAGSPLCLPVRPRRTGRVLLGAGRHLPDLAAAQSRQPGKLRAQDAEGSGPDLHQPLRDARPQPERGHGARSLGQDRRSAGAWP